MTPDRYEAKIRAMIRDSDTWSYWAFDSRRMWAALRRMVKRGEVEIKVLGYPRWGLRVKRGKG